MVDTRSFKGFWDRQLIAILKNMKSIVETLGADLSKATLDAYLRMSKKQEQFENNKKGVETEQTLAKESNAG